MDPGEIDLAEGVGRQVVDNKESTAYAGLCTEGVWCLLWFKQAAAVYVPQWINA